jgi:hypothetical protein
MKQRVVTLMWGTAWERYGKTFVASFDKYWPADVELHIITDKPLPTERAEQTRLDLVPGYNEFMAKYRDDRTANGYDTGAKKQSANGKYWKTDAVKWAPQGLAPRAALPGLNNGDVLCWLDADVETIAKVPKNWANSLIARSNFACLQRDRQHSEIGFWAARVNKYTRAAINRFADLYESGDVFGLDEWHSGFVFDAALASQPTLKIQNLSPGGRGHVWPQSPLARYTVHKKGKIKDGKLNLDRP